MLERDPAKRATAAELLTSDPWLMGNAPETELHHVVVDRIGKFSSNNALVQRAVHTLTDSLEVGEIFGMRNLFESIDTDGSKMLTAEELQVSGVRGLVG